jgi:hypothetical protein
VCSDLLRICFKIDSRTAILAIALREGKLLFVDVQEQKLVASLQLGNKAIFALSYIHQKNELLAVGEEGRLYVINLATYTRIYDLQLSQTTVRSIAVDGDETKIALGDKNGWVYCWIARTFMSSNV